MPSTPSSPAGLRPERVRHDLPWQARFRHGAARMRDALRLLRADPALRRWALVPALVLAALFALALTTTWLVVPGLLDALPSPPTGSRLGARALAIVLRVVTALVWLGFAGMALVLAYMLASVLAAPAHDRLSAHAERLVRGTEDAPVGLGVIATDVAVGVSHSALALGLWLALGCLSLPLALVPGLGSLLQTALWITGSALLLAREAMDYTWSRRRLAFGTKLSVLWRERAATLGLGLTTFALALVPFVNVLVLPVAVVAATLLVLDLEEAGLSPARPDAASPPPGAARPPAPT